MKRHGGGTDATFWGDRSDGDDHGQHGRVGRLRADGSGCEAGREGQAGKEGDGQSRTDRSHWRVFSPPRGIPEEKAAAREERAVLLQARTVDPRVGDADHGR